MMKNTVILWIILSLSACQLGEMESAQWSHSMERIERSSGDCDDASSACATVKVSWPVFKGKSPKVDSLNAFVKNRVKSLIYLGSNEKQYPLYSIQALADSFLQTYSTLLTEMPEYPTKWSNEVQMKVLHQDNNIVSLSLEQYVYTGGAHPNSYTALYNIDRQTGQELFVGEMVKDSTQLAAKVEHAFRKARNINPHQDMADAGFFWGKEFSLPDNIALLEDSVLFYYNSYEIAPYAVGPTEFTIARKELEGLIKLK